MLKSYTARTKRTALHIPKQPKKPKPRTFKPIKLTPGSVIGKAPSKRPQPVRGIAGEQKNMSFAAKEQQLTQARLRGGSHSKVASAQQAEMKDKLNAAYQARKAAL